MEELKVFLSPFYGHLLKAQSQIKFLIRIGKYEGKQAGLVERHVYLIKWIVGWAKCLLFCMMAFLQC